MANNNPLLGSRISLISKKDIRYEGTLYSINENDATVALQNVRSYGTEGREKQTNAQFIPPQSSVHPYLLFRGMDIKDLHVHEKASADKDGGSLPADPAIVSNEVPPEVTAAAAAENSKAAADVTYTAEPKQSNTAPKKSTKTDAVTSDNTGNKSSSNINRNSGNRKTSDNNVSQSHQPRRRNQRKKQAHSNGMVGTGASLLNRKTRGTVDGEEPQVGKDFDLESNTAKFDKDAEFEQLKDAEGDDVTGTDYKKDDFFDDISCDVTDRINGINNRLRGAQERKINTETFGATSLKYYSGNRRGYNRRGGRGRGRGGGRRGPRAENQRWKRDGEKQNRVAAS